VLQHCRITTGSILENITGGMPYTLDDASAAARLAVLRAMKRERSRKQHWAGNALRRVVDAPWLAIPSVNLL